MNPVMKMDEKKQHGHIQNSDQEYKSVHLKLPIDMDFQTEGGHRL